MVKNLLKSVVGVVCTQITIVADICMMPGDAQEPHTKPFPRTRKLVNTATNCFEEAIKPEQDK